MRSGYFGSFKGRRSTRNIDRGIPFAVNMLYVKLYTFQEESEAELDALMPSILSRAFAGEL